MKKTLIIQKDNPVLRLQAKEIQENEITSEHIRDVIRRMKIALHEEEDGVAIAAPQIGESLRIFMTNGELLQTIRNKRRKKGTEEETAPVTDTVYINPTFFKLSKKKKKMDEGCLSVRWLYGLVERSDKATIRAQDEQGNIFEENAKGLLAQIFQHEMDHLEGILFIDKAENIEDHPPTPENE
ncbi:MAG: peptide deformylase, peptide deformylase [Parcubacteria group bacterium]|nr:peptide deformylase, peptide deformylase [Parcubacteria group bacterium]